MRLAWHGGAWRQGLEALELEEAGLKFIVFNPKCFLCLLSFFPYLISHSFVDFAFLGHN